MLKLFEHLFQFFICFLESIGILWTELFVDGGKSVEADGDAIFSEQLALLQGVSVADHMEGW